MEILFVLGFFVVLVLTGVSIFGVLLALMVAALLLFISGLLVFVIKLFPWLLLAVIAAGLWHACNKAPSLKDNKKYQR
ncbi:MULTISPECIES: envelope stress response protein PspG [unclassified Erwinia]|uniref:envelope stress response protein PspG n=1 Tax=unclassified Erwinia TaxID=2622719 RepID=UPI000C179223|nr:MULTISPECIES: envelope stress response protein PspG [unclassified Erwinia]